MHIAFGRVRRRIALLRASFLLTIGVYLETVLENAEAYDESDAA